MNPVRASLRYPQVTIALTIMLVASGVYALLRMPRREDPKIHVREGIVAAFYPGASAAEVENQVTQKVEQRIFKIEGVRREKTYSTSMNGAMFINLNLEDNLQDTEKFWSKLRLDMAELKKTDLPDGVEGPVVDYDFGDTVAVLLAIHSDHYGYRELKDYAERIESAIRRIRAVSKVKRIGEQKEEIDVSSTLDRLSQYAVTPEQVMKALEGRNMVHYAGAVPTERGKPPIQATGAFEAEDQIRHVMVDVSRTGQPVYIGDLANVDRVYKDPTQYARSRGERAILLSVEMQEGNNIVDFGKEVHASLDQPASAVAARSENRFRGGPAYGCRRPREALYPRVRHRHRLGDSGDHAAAAVPRGAGFRRGDSGNHFGNLRAAQRFRHRTAPGVDRRADRGAGDGGGRRHRDRR